MAFRISVDTGGTFTDVVVADLHGIRAIGKALTTPARIFVGRPWNFVRSLLSISTSLSESVSLNGGSAKT